MDIIFGFIIGAISTFFVMKISYSLMRRERWYMNVIIGYLLGTFITAFVMNVTNKMHKMKWYEALSFSTVICLCLGVAIYFGSLVN